MFSTHKSANRTFALLTFFVSLILYVFTMAPTASFWDSGEFIAVAHGLQVMHPPGAPFYSLLGRLFSMLMPASYVAVSINFISALSSALTVMLLYLIIVRLVREFKTGTFSKIDKIGMYGGALLGAFTFSVTDTFWFNAAEAEVYALSMFFTAMVVWLALKWAEHHKEANNERWLLLIAYLFGLALGVHLLNLLALFFVALIFYFKKQDFTFLSFTLAGGVATGLFLAIYPITVQILPSFIEVVSQASHGLIGPVTFITFLIFSLVAGIWYTQKKNMRLANVIILSYVMILIGYSSYALIFTRSLADPPIDMNNPETTDSFISYLEREQYGDTPLLSGHTFDNASGRIDQQEEVLFPRRYSGRPGHLQQYTNYSSDWDFFLDYQVNHMYIRYFNWNFIGRDADVQDTGWQAGFSDTEHENNPAHNSYFYLPFLMGLLGMIYHFQRDWKRALSALVLFVMTGLAIILFLNQTPLQPRERDYAYVGSFFAFAIWIGFGGVGIVDMISKLIRHKFAAYGTLALLFLGIPVWMGYQNYDDHDRSKLYVAPDYAYNLLQSVAPNAILFTGGDNDTYPLWYLQQVEGIRPDVRVVVLSLLNTDWYIKQLRDSWAYKSAPLPISLTDEEIEKMTAKLSFHQPDTVSVPVQKEMLKNKYSDSRSASGNSSGLNRIEVDFGIPVDSLDNNISWYFKGRSAGTDREGNPRYYTRVQDEVVLNILKTNKWNRPIYFASSVPDTDKLNLQSYLRFEGKALRVVPQKHETNSYGWVDPKIHADRLREFRFSQWNNPDVYLNEKIRGMLNNYRLIYTRLSEKYIEAGKPDSARKWLKRSEINIPFRYDDLSGLQNKNYLLSYSYNYARAGDKSNALRLAGDARESLLVELKDSVKNYDSAQNRITELSKEVNRARKNANINRIERINDQIRQQINKRDLFAREISLSINYLTVVQRVLYMTAEEKQAKMLASNVNEITNRRVEFPSSKKENTALFERLNF